MTVIGNPLIIGGGGSTVTLQANKNVSINSNTTTIVVPDVGYEGMEQVTVTTSVPVASLQASKTITISASGTISVTPDVGYDAMEQVNITVPAGSATTPASTISATPAITVNTSGQILAAVNTSANITPTVSAGWVSSGTMGAVAVIGSNTSQLTTKAAATYTPTTSDQTIASGQYLTGAQTIQGDANLVAGNIKKDVSIFGVTGTYEASGGSSSYTLLTTKDFTVNTTSTSAAQIGTIDVPGSAYTSGKILYIRIRDKSGARNGYFVGSDSFFFNPYPANNVTTTLTSAAKVIIRKTSAGVYEVYSTGQSTGYGVYAASITSNGTVNINRRYNSTYSLTINGTYEVKAYLLDYCPDQGNPFDFSYS